jgi:hypothetical protein
MTGDGLTNQATFFSAFADAPLFRASVVLNAFRWLRVPTGGLAPVNLLCCAWHRCPHWRKLQLRSHTIASGPAKPARIRQ